MSSPAATLLQRIRERGPMPFAEFMEEALYGDGGYYTAAVPPAGRGGDFITGPSFSALFGRATERLLRRLDGALGGPAEMLEAGYGGGEHLRAVAAAAASGRRLRAWDRVPRPVPDRVERLGSLGRVGRGEVAGLVFSY
jgi:SAM-dependent MidA family methyltransferase